MRAPDHRPMAAPPARLYPSALASKPGRAAPVGPSTPAAPCAGISAGLAALIVLAIGRASAGELFILWVLLIGWLAYWFFD